MSKIIFETFYIPKRRPIINSVFAHLLLLTMFTDVKRSPVNVGRTSLKRHGALLAAAVASCSLEDDFSIMGGDCRRVRCYGRNELECGRNVSRKAIGLKVSKNRKKTRMTNNMLQTSLESH